MTLQNNDDLSININSDGYSIGGGTTSTRTLSLAGANFPILLSTPVLNQVLQFNGTNWINGSTPINVTSNLTYTSGTLDLGTSLAPASGGQFTISGSAYYGLLHLISSGTNTECSISYSSSNVPINGSGAWDLGANIVPSLFGTGNFSLFNSNLSTLALSANASNNYVSIGKANPAYPLDVNGAVNTSGSYLISGTALRVENLANVVETSLTAGNILQYNGTNWVNANINGVQGSTQRVYVDKSGNDTIGNPYLTIPAAIASITDASVTKKYVISVGPGTYANNFSLPANIFIDGIDVVATVVSGTIDINNTSWNGTGAPLNLSGFSNITLAGTSTFDFSLQTNNNAGVLYFWNTKINTPLTFNGQNATNTNQLVVENCKINGGTLNINGLNFAQINNTAGNNTASFYVTSLSSAGVNCSLNNTSLDGTISVVGTNPTYPAILNLNNAGITSTTVLTATGSGVIINSTVDSIPSLGRQTFGTGVTLNYNNPIYISTVNGSAGINVGTTSGNAGGTATLSLGAITPTSITTSGTVSTGALTATTGSFSGAVNATGTLSAGSTVNTSGSYLVAGTALRLNNLADVNATEAIGNFLIYGNTANEWVNGTFLNYSSLGTSTTTATTQQNKISGTTPSLAAGQYVITWSYSYSYSTAARTFIGQVLFDGTQLNVLNSITNTTAGASGAVISQLASGFQQVTLGAGTHTYALTYGASNGSDTASIWNAYVKIQQVA
jgi:hypothetical protein